MSTTVEKLIDHGVSSAEATQPKFMGTEAIAHKAIRDFLNLRTDAPPAEFIDKIAQNEELIKEIAAALEREVASSVDNYHNTIDRDDAHLQEILGQEDYDDYKTRATQFLDWIKEDEMVAKKQAEEAKKVLEHSQAISTDMYDRFAIGDNVQEVKDKEQQTIVDNQGEKPIEMRKMTLQEAGEIGNLQHQLQQAAQQIEGIPIDYAKIDNLKAQIHDKKSAFEIKDPRVEALQDEKAAFDLAGDVAGAQEVQARIDALDPLGKELREAEEGLETLKLKRDAALHRGQNQEAAGFDAQIKAAESLMQSLEKQRDPFSEVNTELERLRTELKIADGSTAQEAKAHAEQLRTQIAAIDIFPKEPASAKAEAPKPAEAGTRATEPKTAGASAAPATVSPPAVTRAEAAPAAAVQEKTKQREVTQEKLTEALNATIEALKSAKGAVWGYGAEGPRTMWNHHNKICKSYLKDIKKGNANISSTGIENSIILTFTDPQIKRFMPQAQLEVIRANFRNLEPSVPATPRADARPAAPPPEVKVSAKVAVETQPESAPKPNDAKREVKNERTSVRMADWIDVDLIVNDLASRNDIVPDQITADAIQEEVNKQHKTIRVRTESTIKTVQVGDIRKAVESRRAQAASQEVSASGVSTSSTVESTADAVEANTNDASQHTAAEQPAQGRVETQNETLSRAQAVDIFNEVIDYLREAGNAVTDSQVRRSTRDQLRESVNTCNEFIRRLGADDDALDDPNHLQSLIGAAQNRLSRTLGSLLEQGVIDPSGLPDNAGGMLLAEAIAHVGSVQEGASGAGISSPASEQAATMPADTSAIDGNSENDTDAVLDQKESPRTAQQLLHSIDMQMARGGRIDLSRISSVANEIMRLPVNERNAFIETYKPQNRPPADSDPLDQRTRELVTNAINYRYRPSDI